MRAADETRPAPWYRQRWPWLIMLPPAAAVVGGSATLALALWNPEYDVRDGHYRQGLGVYRVAASPESAPAVAVSALLAIHGDGRITMQVDGARPSAGVVVRLIEPTRAGTAVDVQLQETDPGRFEGRTSLPRADRWDVEVVDPVERWRLTGTFRRHDHTVRLVGLATRAVARPELE